VIEKTKVIIIGGGPSGLSAALTFGRAMINTLLINDEKPRHFASSKSHGYINADGLPPKDFLERSKNELSKYHTVRYLKDKVMNLSSSENCFAVKTENGENFSSQYLIVATGLNDNISKLNIDGLEKVYGKSIFPCPFCDGYEHRDMPCALIVQREGILNYIKLITHWSSQLTVFTNGFKLPNDEIKQIKELTNIPVVEDSILKINSTFGKLTGIATSDDKVYACNWGILFNGKERQNFLLPKEFNIEKTEFNTYMVNEACQTALDKLYIIGDAINSFSHVSRAVSEGAYTARAITSRIIHSK